MAYRLAELLALALTIPAFYMAALGYQHAAYAALYTVAAVVCTIVLCRDIRMASKAMPAAQGASTAHRHTPHLSALLIGALALSAALHSGDSSDLLGVRLFTAALALLRVGQSFQPRFWRGSMSHLLTLAVGILGLCGLGFWWLEPRVHSLGDGMWLAFTTAATVGYGDIVPTTSASKIFAVFVVLLGVSALSLVTAAIAAMWVRSGEKKIEDEILRDLHRQLSLVHRELTSLKQMMLASKDGSDSR